MKIIVDAMGGDHAPLEISPFRRQGLPGNVSIVNATEVIDMHDDPATAFKLKRDSSMTVGLNLLKAGDGDAFVSAGSTGALLSAGTLLSNGPCRPSG